MARKLEVQIVGDAGSLSRAFSRAANDANGFGSKVSAGIGLAARAVAAGGAAIGLGLGYAIKQAADFQSELNTFRAVSQASGAQMKAVSALAKKLGADVSLPATSAKDAAKAMTELSKAGLSVKNTMAAAKGVLQLSAAAETDNATAATIAANALNAFHLPGTQAAHIADLLAAASIAASGSMTDMADALKYTSATAAQAHVPIEDTVAAISELANKGIQGGEAGAAIQQMLLRLESPTKKASAALKDLGVNVYDTRGKMLPLPSLIDQFSKATAGLSDSQRNAALNAIFGSRAIRAANVVLLGGKDAFDKMRTAVDRHGAAADVAKAKMAGFNGAVQALKSSVETLAITIGTPLLNSLTFATRGLAGVVNWIDRLVQTPGIKLKVEMAENAARSLEEKLGAIVGRINWTAVWGQAKGLATGLQHRFESINWTAVGEAIGGGLSSAVEKAISGTKGLPSAFEKSFRTIDWVKLGRAAGPGITAAVASAIATALDPAFWVKNWDLALAIGSALFTRGIGRIAARFTAPLAGMFTNAFREIALMVGAKFGVLGELAARGAIAMTHLIGRGLSSLAGIVGGKFSQLGRLARFTVKVLGIQAAIDAIVQLASALIEKLKKLAGDALGWGKEIGASIARGVIDGLGGLAGAVASKVRGALHSALSIAGKALRGSGEFMWTKHVVGIPMMQGIAEGIAAGSPGVTAAAVAAAGRAANAARAEVNRIQAQIDADQRRRQDADNARALRDAEHAAAAAQKKGKGVAEAEKQLADAQQAIRDTAAQRELDAAQKKYDRAQAAFEKAQAKLQAAQQKALDRLQAAQDKAGSAFDRVADKIRQAFGARGDSWVAPAQQAIDAIMGRRHAEDLQQAIDDAAAAVDDAKKAVADANDLQQTDTETDQEYAVRKAAAVAEANARLLAAQRTYERSKEDVTVEGMQRDADAQQRGHDQLIAAQSEALDQMLSNLREKLTSQGETYDNAMKDVLGILGEYDISFATIGALLGSKFAAALQAQIQAAAASAQAVLDAGVSAGASAAAVRPDDRAGPRGFNPGGTTVSVAVNGSVVTERQLQSVVTDGVLTANRRGGLLARDLE